MNADERSSATTAICMHLYQGACRKCVADAIRAAEDAALERAAVKADGQVGGVILASDIRALKSEKVAT